MNRREFTLSSAAIFALFATGCNANKTTIADFVTTIGQDAAALASYFNKTDLAKQILADTAQISIAITNWQSGSPVQQAVQAIQALMNLLGAIPVVGPYVPLLDLLLSALSGLLLLLPGATGAAVPHAISGRAVKPMHYNGYDHKSMAKAKKDFEAQWKAMTAVAPLVK